MVWVLADSGGSKTDWLVVAKGHATHRWRTTGLNPNLIGQQALTESLKHNVAPRLEGLEPAGLLFFGAGLANDHARQYMKRALQLHLGISCPVWVDSDLRAAALAGLHRAPGIVGLLGTGSVAFRFDGHQVLERRGGWGYLLGDEGGGIDLGRSFLRGLLENTVPAPIVEKYVAFAGLQPEDLTERLYLDDHPARFMAAQVPFLVTHRSEPFISDLVADRFAFFVENYLATLRPRGKEPLVLMGGIARSFKDILLAQTQKVGLGTVYLPDTAIIDGLASYLAAQPDMMDSMSTGT